jgi:hypothetical protein
MTEQEFEIAKTMKQKFVNAKDDETFNAIVNGLSAEERLVLCRGLDDLRLEVIAKQGACMELLDRLEMRRRYRNKDRSNE